MTDPELIPTPNHVVAGQAYWLVGSEPYRRTDGSEAALDIYATHCAECGQRFEAKAPAGATRGFTRRCPAHRRPGTRV